MTELNYTNRSRYLKPIASDDTHAKKQGLFAIKPSLLIMVLLLTTALQTQTFNVNTGFPPPVQHLLQQIMQQAFAKRPLPRIEVFDSIKA